MTSTVMVVGTGTIGEPLIGLLCDFREQLGISEVLFYKRTPLLDEVAKVNSLIERGAGLVAMDNEAASRFESMGNRVMMTYDHALTTSDVVVDCTPAGNTNKELFYNDASKLRSTRFIAQGSEKGFGLPYAYGINDEVLANTDDPSFVQIVSCNTHNIARLITTLADIGPILHGDFVCMRRANDVSQDRGYVASTTVGVHDDPKFGTHHARDVHDLLKTLGNKVTVFSSAVKISTQYMHAIRFLIQLGGRTNESSVIEALKADRFVAFTYKDSANKVFSFGRDHGYYGRIFNQAVIPVQSLSVTQNRGTNTSFVAGFCFTPQDGNSLLSSVAAVARALHGPGYEEKLGFLDELLFQQI